MPDQSLFYSVTSSSSGVSSVSGNSGVGVSTRSVKSYETSAAIIIKKTKKGPGPKPIPKKTTKKEPKV